MIYQLHYQFKDHTEFREQKELNFPEHGQKEFHDWIDDALKKHPTPPEGAKWMVCDERSEFFVGVRPKEGHGN